MKRLSLPACTLLSGILLTLQAWSQPSALPADSTLLARRTPPVTPPVPTDRLQFSRLVLGSGARSAATVIHRRIEEQRAPADPQNAPLQVDSSAPTPGRSKQFAVGFLATLPTAGVSGILNLSPRTAAQGLLGMFIGGIRTATGRFLYYFCETTNFQPYVLGELGLWGYDEDLALGIGAGGGLEYFIERYPWVSLNLEFTLRQIDFEHNDYNISGFAFGGGVHYYF